VKYGVSVIGSQECKAIELLESVVRTSLRRFSPEEMSGNSKTVKWLKTTNREEEVDRSGDYGARIIFYDP
jgi:hypothetical protein